MARSDEKPVFEWVAPRLPWTPEAKKDLWGSLFWWTFFLAVFLFIPVGLFGYFHTWPNPGLSAADFADLGLLFSLLFIVNVATLLMGHRYRSRVRISEKAVKVDEVRRRFSALRYARFTQRTANGSVVDVLNLISRDWSRISVAVAPSIPTDSLRRFLATKVPLCHGEAADFESAMTPGASSREGVVCLSAILPLFFGVLLILGGAYMLVWGGASESMDRNTGEVSAQVEAIQKILSEAGFSAEQAKALKVITWRAVYARVALSARETAFPPLRGILVGVVLVLLGPLVYLLERTRIQRKRLLYLVGREEARLLVAPPPAIEGPG